MVLNGGNKYRHGWAWFDVVLAAMAVVAVGLLVRSYVRPRPAGSTNPERVAARFAREVEGKVLPGIPFFAPNSAVVDTVDFGVAGTTLLLAFASTCPACDANHSNWVRLLERTTAIQDLRVLAVAADSSGALASDWLAERGIHTDAILIPAEPTMLRARWHVLGVPATYVIDGDGRVVRARFGILSADDADNVLHVLREQASVAER